MAGMEVSAKASEAGEVLPWRDMYRLEMIVRSSMTRSTVVLNGPKSICSSPPAPGRLRSVAVAGPWKASRPYASFTFCRTIDCMRSICFTPCCVQRRRLINVQTNDSLITVMLHTFAHAITSDSVLFNDSLTTALSPTGATFRGATPAEVLTFPAIN